MHPVWLALAFPLLGALVCGFFARLLGRAATAVVASAAVLAAFGASLVSAGRLGDQAQWTGLWTWLDSAPLRLEVAALVDPLSLTMLWVVTGVGFLIHWYSAGYMADERDYGRYFAYLNLFVAAMVMLVIAANFVLLLVGWAGVGFASFALIGFWYQRPSAVLAARKAFVVNVLGDLGLVLAILVMAASLQGSGRTIDLSLDSASLQVRALQSAAPWICGLLLLAAYAKSAQLPLHTWLPDAMEGPTPVSALIHAATMVTAGVYLVCRTSPLFQAAPAVSAVVALLGAATAFVAATSALAQKDLKRVLAYSTMSQLGYMFLAAGAGAYTAAMFHLVTHAFFKALLFLAAGMVIHALHGEQDMTRMGGLRRSLPGPYGAFLIGTLAISGMPFFSGAVSKDLILESVYVSGGAAAAGLDLVAWLSAAGLWLAALATSALTAFYMFRALFLTFHGSPRQEHPDLHRPGPSMTAPAGILAILTVLGGLAFEEPLMHHLQPLLRGVEVQGLSFSVRHLAPAAALLVGALLAGAVYLWRRPSPERLERALGPVFTFLRQGWGFDALYYYTVNLPLRALAGWLQGPVEEDASRRLPTGLGQALLEFGQGLRLLQTGLVRNYALGIVLGLVLLLGYALLVIGRGS